MKFIKKLGYGVFLAAMIAACATTESINQEAAQKYAQVKAQARQQNAIDVSSPTAKRIHAVFNKTKPYAEKANETGVPFQWEITVLKSDELNAWAMPGGKMAFYTGLVERLNLSDDEIAVVMGHEMAHALKEHGKSDRTVSAITGIVGVIADVAVTASTGVNTEGLLSTGVDLIATKPFSRSQETEADEVGLMLMAEAGYNPSAAPNVWIKMSKANGSSGLSIFSTHPSNEERQENLARLVPEAMKIYNARK
ncbi:deoxyribonuclease HsdR [Mannheimia granulomatis]|uniref:Deoxyribonuclease HsdR n=1 Tax=Mannheimia granulomatis TaxID=85402 RepID=A0A6G8JJH5_9PAST|nr:M48 family metallopeptidase [Mannheimia granulomatis]QIM67340.1 deoxyribonuclease HsdR [Mannheimia granulomatis]QLB13961.1 deoxyribonuclease HsdR [Mannheimia granulomatis]QLB19703.1 deoxyribonuclease HsdR [Mannheimia granulomatis]